LEYLVWFRIRSHQALRWPEPFVASAFGVSQTAEAALVREVDEILAIRRDDATATLDQVPRGAGSVRRHLSDLGPFDLLGVAAYSAGATKGYLSVVLAASAIFPMIAVALSMVFLRERLVLNQYLGVVAVVGGLLLLALAPG